MYGKTFFRRLTVLMLGSLCTGAAQAQAGAQAALETDTLSLGLTQAVAWALEKNPTIKVAETEVRLKETAKKEAWQNLLPQADLSGSLSHTVKAPEMKLGAKSFKLGLDHSNTAAGVLSVNLPLLMPAVYQAMSLTKTDLLLAREKANASKEELVNAVTKAYYQLMMAQDSRHVLAESKKLAEENLCIVTAKFEQGVVSEFDKITAEVQLQNINPELMAARQAVTMAELQLRVLMGITASVHIKAEDSLASHAAEMRQPQQQTNVPVDLSGNSSIKQMLLGQELLKKNIKTLKAGLLPTLGMRFSYQSQSLNNLNLNLPKYDWVNSSSVVFSLSIPLFRASDYTKIETAKLQLMQQQWQQTDAEDKLKLQVTSLQNSMNLAVEQLEGNEENIKKARKAQLIAQKRYEMGGGTILELNNAQVQLMQAELTYQKSVYDYLVAKADLEKTLGTTLLAPQHQ